MAIWLFCPRGISGESQANSLTITYLWPCKNFSYVPIYARMLFQSTMYGTTICASTRLIFQSVVLGTTFHASTRIIILGTTFRASITTIIIIFRLL